MSETNKENDGWFPDGLELIPFGERIDAVAHFLGGLLRYHAHEPLTERGAEGMLRRMQDENLSGFGYIDEDEL